MKLEIQPMHPSEVQEAWKVFVNHPMKRVLHNELVQRIRAVHEELESVSREDLPAKQGEIKALKVFIGLIHRHDPAPTK